MIPKVIHYCWFGNNPLPEKLQKYIDTWKQMMPDYQIKQWNESNIDLQANQYIKDAYANHKYAFVSDYARLYALYTEGGFYLDTDIEVLKRFDDLTHYDLVVGFETNDLIETAFIGASQKNEVIEEFLLSYNTKVFDLNQLEANTVPFTKLIEKRGIKINGKLQMVNGIFVGSNDYFLGFDYNDFGYCINDHTYTIHHCFGSWTSTKEKVLFKVKRFLRTVLGKKGYLLLKKIIK